MKKILSALLVLAMLCVNLTLPAMAVTTEADSSFIEEKIYFYSDFSAPSDIGSLVENTSADIKPEIKTSSDGKSVLSFTRGNTKEKYQYAAFNVAGTSSAPIKVEGAPELVVEYMARLASMGDSTYFATNAKCPTASIRKIGVYYNQYKYEEAELLKSKSSTEWVKITTVYSNKAETRDVYINDKFIKTLSTTDDNNKNVTSANPYYNGGCKSFYIPFGFSGNVGNSAELDYLKVYAKTENFMAKIKDSENASVLGVEVEFNSPVNPSDITKENFTLTDGTNSITVSNVLKTSENTLKVVPAAPLATGKNYTLNIAINSDIFGTTLSTKALSFKTSSEVEFVDGEELYYNTFDSELGFSRTIEVVNEIVYGLDTTDDGISIFKAEGTDVYQNSANYGFVSPQISADSGYNEVVLEYKLRVNADNPDSYMGTWSNQNSLSNGWTRALDIARGEKTKDKLYFHYTNAEPIPGDHTINPKEWNTITIVYPRDRKSRDIYVNGEFIATSPEGDLENTYASKGFMHYVMLPDFRCSDDLLEVDYYKFTNKTTLFDATLINADSGSVFVKFNTTPANISPDAFALSDGTAISEIKAIDERTYMLSFDAPLSAGSYTLSLNGLKDTLGRTIDRESLSFDINGSLAKEEIYYYSDFSKDEDIGNLTTSNLVVPTITTSADESGTSVLRLMNDTANNSNASGYFYLSGDKNTPVSIDGAPKVILEYRVRMVTGSNYSYFSTNPSKAAGVTIGGGGKFRNKLRANSKAAEALDVSYVETDWNKITVVYNNAECSRDVYVNDIFIGTLNSDAKDYSTYDPNAYYTSGCKEIYLGFIAHMQNLGDYTELDYVKLYSVPELKIEEVTSSDDLKTVYVDFNSMAADITPEMIKVGGQQPESVELYDEEEQIYALNLTNKLKSETDYAISIMGVKAIGSECYDVIDFTTRAAKEYDLTVSENAENLGTVEIEGVEATSGKAFEDSDVTIRVKPFVNYEAVVTVDGKDIFKDRFDKYVIRNIKADTEVKVTYTEVTNDAVVSEAIETIPFYQDKISVYAFGVLRRVSDEFGVIAASSKANLTFEAVEAGNAYKFEAESTNKYGEYGIRLIDVSKKLGSSYYVIPYAVYGDTVVYGTAHSIKR